MSRHETLRWQQAGWTFVLTAGGSYICVYEGERHGLLRDLPVPYDMVDRPPVPRTSETTFRAACVAWLIERAPVRPIPPGVLPPR